MATLAAGSSSSISSSGYDRLSDLGKTLSNTFPGPSPPINYSMVQNGGVGVETVVDLGVTKNINPYGNREVKSSADSVNRVSDGEHKQTDNTESKEDLVSMSSGQEAAFEVIDPSVFKVRDEYKNKVNCSKFMKDALLEYYKSNDVQKYNEINDTGINNGILCNSFKRGKQLGQGAQADLYETTFAGNKYALRHEKVNPKKMKSLIDEMKVHDIIMADINNISPYITKTQCYYFGDEESDNNIYFNVVMEKCKFDVGKYLEHLKDMRTSPSEAFVGRFFECMLPGLKYLHEKQLFHRDLKLANILIYEDENKNWIFKICDFGFTRPADNSDTDGSHGTPAFMAPELLQANGKKRSSKSDVWALGISLYYMITGELPYPEVENKMALLLHISRLPQLSSNIPAIVLPYNSIISNSMTDLVNKMLIVDPANRISVDDAIREYEEECKTIEEENQEKEVKMHQQQLLLSGLMEGTAKTKQRRRHLSENAKVKRHKTIVLSDLKKCFDTRRHVRDCKKNVMSDLKKCVATKNQMKQLELEVQEKDAKLNAAHCRLKRIKYEKEFPKGTSFIVACEKGRLDDVKLFITSHDVNKTSMTLTDMLNQEGKDSNGDACVPLAAAKTDDIKQYLLDQGADPAVLRAFLIRELPKKYKKEFPEGTPLVCACQYGRFEDVKLLITGRNNDVNGSNGNNNNNNNMTLKEYVNQEGKNSGGYVHTPLIIAARNEHFQIVKYLIEQCEADPNIASSYGNNALHWAAEYNNKNTKLIELLLTNMPLNSINKKNRIGNTPLDWAYNNSRPIQQKIIDLIRSKGGKRRNE